MITFGELLKKYKIRDRYSYQKLADLIGVGKQTIVNWVYDISKPSKEKYVLKLAIIFELSEDEINEFLITAGHPMLDILWKQVKMSPSNQQDAELIDLLKNCKQGTTNFPPDESHKERIQRCKTNLLKGQETNFSARTLGDLAIQHHKREAIAALWEAICETKYLAIIIDPCAYTVGRIVWQTQDSVLEDIGFNIFNKSTMTKFELILDKFAYIVGEVFLKTGKGKTRQRAWNFINNQISSPDPSIATKYRYTKNRVEKI